jgi:hypothetical protein
MVSDRIGVHMKDERSRRFAEGVIRQMTLGGCISDVF